jgi:hypothetical protein
MHAMNHAIVQTCSFSITQPPSFLYPEETRGCHLTNAQKTQCPAMFYACPNHVMDANSMEITWVRIPPFPARPQRDCNLFCNLSVIREIHARHGSLLVVQSLSYLSLLVQSLCCRQIHAVHGSRGIHYTKIQTQEESIISFCRFRSRSCMPWSTTLYSCIARKRSCRRFQMSDSDDTCN